MDAEVELESHLVPEFDLDVAVASGEKAWTIIDHGAARPLASEGIHDIPYINCSSN
jgi:hypothetical protein